MKKIIYTFVVYFIFINILTAQDKYGNTWLIGNGTKSYNRLTWEQDSLNIIQPTTKSEAFVGDPNACISDKKGNLLFYTSGCCVSSAKNYKVLPNGKKINPNEVYDVYCGVNETQPYPSNNNVMFLPHPTDTSLYYLFHMARKAVNDTADQYPFTYFYYSVLDTKMGINGDIAKKNVLITEGRLSEVGPAGCKHGNGRDYWVIIPNTITHSFFRALLTKDTVLYMGEQKIGEKFGRTASQWNGQGVFSPDGNKYVRSDPFNGTYIYDFDRCTGEMSNPVFIDTIGTNSNGVSGVAISPNSRYLYIANRIYVHQFDLWAKDILKTKQKIGAYNGEVSDTGLETYIYRAALAPDNKIYLSASNNNQYLHVIHYPDSAGVSCQFKMNGLKLAASNEGLPNMTNFNLGPKIGSPCEKELSVNDELYIPETIKVYPNPASTVLNVFITVPYTVLGLYDMTGRCVKHINTSPYQSDYKIEVSDIPVGVYVLSGIAENGKRIGAQKVVIE